MKARSFAENHGRKRCPGLGQRWLLVWQQYDQSEQQDRERANLNDDSQFANTTVTEQILIISVTSKIVIQPLEPDTDAQLHMERVISVRKEAEICISSSTRDMSQVK